MLSESALLRMQAAIDAARGEMQAEDQDPITEPIPRIVAEQNRRKDKHAAAVSEAGAKAKPDPKPGGPTKRGRLTTSGGGRRTGQAEAHQAAASAAVTEMAKPETEAPPVKESVAEIPARTVPAPVPTPGPAPQPQAPEEAHSVNGVSRRGPEDQPGPSTAPRRIVAFRSAQQARPAASHVLSAAGKSEAKASAAGLTAPAGLRPPAGKTPGTRQNPATHSPPGRRAQPDQHGVRRRRAATRPVAAGVIVVALVAVGFALLGHSPQPARADHKLTALQRQEAVNRGYAAAWVKHQVSPGTAISCDKDMCAALAAVGYPQADLQVLGAASLPPLTSSLVIATAGVRSQFGGSLDAAIAPAAITIIGSGPAAISVRLVAPDGAAAFRKGLAEGQQARQQNEAALQGGTQITTSATAQAELAGGSVDMRLVLAITSVAAAVPVYVDEFGNTATGSSPGVPLRFADLADADAAAHLSSKAYEAKVLAALRAVPAQYRPLWARTVRLSSGETVIRIDVGAPSPLGLPSPANG